MKIENNDILKKYLAYNKSVKVTVVNATNMVQKARDMHLLSNVVTAALGRLIIVTTMMSSDLKEKDDRLTVQISGDGKIQKMVACGNKDLNIKAYALNNDVNLPLNENNKLDVAKAVGKGILTVIKDIGLKEPYVGKCNLITSEIAEDFAYYFYTSEQTPSVVSLGVNIGKDQKVQMAAGYIIQPLPDCDESIIDILETINNNISSVTNLMLDLSNIDDVAKTITGDNDIVLTETKNINYVCDCNEKRIENVIIALGKDEAIKSANDNDGILELTCHFCNKVYRFNINDIEKIFNDEVK